MSTSRAKNSFLNGLSGLGGLLLATILKFVNRTVFIYVLGIEYLGISILFANILQVLAVTELGVDTAINFKLYKPIAENDDKRVRCLVKFYRDAYRMIGLAILCLGLLLIPFLPVLIKDIERLYSLEINPVLIYLLYLAQSVSSYCFFSYRGCVVSASQKEYKLTFINYLMSLLSNVTQIAVLLLCHSFILYVGTVIIFNLLHNFLRALVATRLFPQYFIAEEEKLSRSEMGGMLKDCAALLIYKVNRVVLHSTDNIIISAFLGLAIVGLYSNYLLFYGVLRSFAIQFYNAIRASMGNLFATENLETGYLVFETVNFLTILLYGTACIGIGVLANDIIACWIGAQYVIPQPLAALSGIALLFAGLKSNLGQVRNVTGAFRQMWYRPLTGILINVIVSLILVQKIGICGVLIGTILADLLTNFMIDPAIIHRHSFKNIKPVSEYYKKNLAYLALLAIVGMADWMICQLVLPGNGVGSIVTHILICGMSVPMFFFAVYRKSEVCLYLLRRVRSMVAILK